MYCFIHNYAKEGVFLYSSAMFSAEKVGELGDHKWVKMKRNWQPSLPMKCALFKIRLLVKASKAPF